MLTSKEGLQALLIKLGPLRALVVQNLPGVTEVWQNEIIVNLTKTMLTRTMTGAFTENYKLSKSAMAAYPFLKKYNARLQVLDDYSIPIFDYFVTLNGVKKPNLALNILKCT